MPTFQHPLPTTIDTFWKMIHKDRVDAVIMLNEITPDCPNYLPSAVGVARSFADVKVTLIEQAPLAPELPFIIYSKMAIQRKKEDGAKVDPKSDEYDKRKFKHFQWLNWPKNSVPEVTNGIEMMLTSIRNTNRPIVVHCTDGATRSGVVVLVEQLFESITMGQGNADTGDMLKKIRDQRQKAIGNEAVSKQIILTTLMTKKGSKLITSTLAIRLRSSHRHAPLRLPEQYGPHPNVADLHRRLRQSGQKAQQEDRRRRKTSSS